MPLIDYYNEGDDANSQCYGVAWRAQTFTASQDYEITSVKLKMYRIGLPGTFTVSLRATSGSLPTGGDLTSGDIDADTFTLDYENPQWYEITFSSGYELSNGVEYALVWRAINGTGSKMVMVRVDESSATYAGGVACYSSNSGGSWSSAANFDFVFETYGSGVQEYDEGTKTVIGAGVVSLSSESGTFVYDEGILLVSAGTAISLEKESYRSVSGWPNIRPSDYDEDLIWDEESGAWIAADGSGGSRYQTQVVVVGYDDDGYGVVYFGATS